MKSIDNTIPPNNAPREYTNKIDFTSEYENWGLRGIFMVQTCSPLQFAWDIIVGSGDVVNIELQPMFDIRSASRRCVILNVRSLISCQVKKAVDCILEICEKRKDNLTYKEGNFGYKIDYQGNILEKWELDDGMC